MQIFQVSADIADKRHGFTAREFWVEVAYRLIDGASSASFRKQGRPRSRIPFRNATHIFRWQRRRNANAALLALKRRYRNWSSQVSGWTMLGLSKTRQAIPQASALRLPPDELFYKGIGGSGYELVRLGELRNATLFHNEHAIAELEGLANVVGNEEDRQTETALQVQKLILQRAARDLVDGAERFVHEHDERLGG